VTAPPARKLILVVIDGLTPSMLERGLEEGTLPAIAAVAERGELGRAVTVFPSLTPVCLSSISTGAYPDVHEIPHLVWWHRGERRLVEYGSSFGAARAAGLGRTLRDTLVGMNADHLGRAATTVFEALADAGLVTAAVNFTAYRGRTRHPAAVPLLGEARGPERFFFYNLFESDATGAPLSWRNRAAGTVDAYAAAVARWLVTRDAFDFFLLYLSDYDYASHAAGPDAAHDVLARCDAVVGDVAAAAGGVDALLERYAVVIVSDHGQTTVSATRDLREGLRDVDGVLAVASNRAGMVYRLDGCRLEAREIAARVEDDPAVEVTLFREGDLAVARREGGELRFVPSPEGFSLEGDATVLDHPDGPQRAWAALACPNAGEVLVSATAGWEFTDLGGRHHLGGGSHGSLLAGDSIVPVITTGLGPPPARLVDLYPAILGHFGVEPPGYVLRRAA
jgi:predicted AlkP superfamily pyrophosphatase or phosphodiesterase